jgi:hypothetical protein
MATSPYTKKLDANLHVVGDLAIDGIPTAPTASPGTNTTQLATTAFVHDATTGVTPATWPIPVSAAGGGTPSIVFDQNGAVVLSMVATANL